MCACTRHRHCGRWRHCGRRGCTRQARPRLYFRPSGFHRRNERIGRCYRIHYTGHDGRIYPGKFHGWNGGNILSPIWYDYGHRHRSVRSERFDIKPRLVCRSSETAQAGRFRRSSSIEGAYENSLQDGSYNNDKQIYRSNRKDVASGNHTHIHTCCHSRYDFRILQYQSGDYRHPHTS